MHFVNWLGGTGLLNFHRRQILKGEEDFFFVLCCYYLCLSEEKASDSNTSGKAEETYRKNSPRRKWPEAPSAHLSLSLSSLLRERSLFSGSRSRSLSLSWFVTEELRSESVGLGHWGGVGKDGGVRWSLFHGSWGLLKFCRFGPSLWVKMLLWARITAGGGRVKK